MPGKEFTFGFVLSAAMNSSFATSFSKASKEVDELGSTWTGLQKRRSA